MKTMTFYLSFIVIFHIFWIPNTYGNYDTEPCSLTIENNKTFFQRLLGYYELDGETIIIKYTLNFQNVSANFNLSRQSNPNAFQPERWYSTRGVGSPRLLLTYEFLYGIMEWVLSYCTEKEVLNLNVYPPDCMDNLENETLEDFLVKFLLKDLNIGHTPVKDLHMCSARYVVNNGHGNLIYSCHTLDPFGGYNWYAVEVDDDVMALQYFITFLVVFAALFLPIAFPQEYRMDTYEFTIPTGLNAIVHVTRDNPGYITFEMNEEKQDVPGVFLKNMKKFHRILGNTSQCSRFRLKKILVDVPLDKMFSGDKNDLSFFITLCQMVSECCRAIKDIFHADVDVRGNYNQTLKNSNHDESNRQRHQSIVSNTTKKSRSGKHILKHFFVMLFVYALSAPILISRCIDGTRYREVQREFIKRIRKINDDTNIDIDLSWAIWTASIISILYFSHFVFFLIWEKNYRQFYTAISNYNEKLQCSRKNKKCCKVNCCIIMLLKKLPNLYGILAIINLMGKSLRQLMKMDNIFLAMGIYMTSFAAIILSITGIYFLVNFVVILILIAAMEGGQVYNIIKIALLLAAYVYKSVKQVHEPFENFMRSLFKTQLIKKLSMGRRDQNNPLNGSVLGQLEKPIFLVTDTDLWAKLNHPFIDVYEKKISQKFLFQCASVGHSETPGTVLHNFFKALKHFGWIAFFIIFVYLVLMAHGHIIYISLSNPSFTAFAVALIPIIISNFLIRGADKIESTDESKKLLEKKLCKKLKDFRQSWIVNDLIMESLIPNDNMNNPEANDGGTNGAFEEIDEENEDIGIWNLAKDKEADKDDDKDKKEDEGDDIDYRRNETIMLNRIRLSSESESLQA